MTRSLSSLGNKFDVSRSMSILMTTSTVCSHETLWSLSLINGVIPRACAYDSRGVEDREVVAESAIMREVGDIGERKDESVEAEWICELVEVLLNIDAVLNLDVDLEWRSPLEMATEGTERC